MYCPGHLVVPGVPELLSCQDADTVRHHVILGEALSSESLQRGGHRNSLLGPAHWLVFYNHSGQVCRGRGLGACNLHPRDHPAWRLSPEPVSPKVRVVVWGVDSVSYHPPQPEVNHMPLEGPVLEAPGRSLFGLSGVLSVGSSRCLHSHAEALRVRG